MFTFSMRFMEDSTFAISYNRLTFAAELSYTESVSQRALLINMIQAGREERFITSHYWGVLAIPKQYPCSFFKGNQIHLKKKWFQPIKLLTNHAAVTNRGNNSKLKMLTLEQRNSFTKFCVRSPSDFSLLLSVKKTFRFSFWMSLAHFQLSLMAAIFHWFA